MTDETPTNEELLTKIEILEQELDEMAGKVERLNKLEKACYDLAQKLAKERGEALADWWWVH
jgi:TolA-binding protein